MSQNITTPMPDFNPKIFGNNVIQARNRLGMKQKELATLIEISDHTLSDIETGKGDVSLRRAFIIAKYVQTPLLELLNLNEVGVIHNLNNNQQEGKVNILNSGRMSSEREMFELRIEELKEHMAALEKICTDLREDKAALRSEIARLRP